MFGSEPVETAVGGGIGGDDVKPAATRRGFLLLSLGLLAGCATDNVVRVMPAPPWPASKPRPRGVDRGAEVVSPSPATRSAPWRDTVLPRKQWAVGRPVPSQMDRMTTIRYITVHHDGMSPFYEMQPRAVAARIELIRQRHRGRGWGDIGYHFVVDRAGRVWEGRPLSYQGAHVSDHNPGNIGVVALGDLDQQVPSTDQLEALWRHVRLLMQAYDVSPKRVLTHQEWGAVTACPGRNLQRYMDTVRRRAPARFG